MSQVPFFSSIASNQPPLVASTPYRPLISFFKKEVYYVDLAHGMLLPCAKTGELLQKQNGG
jgi:hypothetical protein